MFPSKTFFYTREDRTSVGTMTIITAETKITFLVFAWIASPLPLCYDRAHSKCGGPAIATRKDKDWYIESRSILDPLLEQKREAFVNFKRRTTRSTLNGNVSSKFQYNLGIKQG